MQHALVQYSMDMQQGLEKRLDALGTETLRAMREELTNLEPAAVGQFVLSELDKKLEESFNRVPPDYRPSLPQVLGHNSGAADEVGLGLVGHA